MSAYRYGSTVLCLLIRTVGHFSLRFPRSPVSQSFSDWIHDTHWPWQRHCSNVDLGYGGRGGRESRDGGERSGAEKTLCILKENSKYKTGSEIKVGNLGGPAEKYQHCNVVLQKASHH